MKWPTGALDSIAILDRQSIHPSEAEAATPYLGLEHLDSDGGIDCIQTVGSAGLKSNKFQFSDRHVLFGKLRPYLRKIVRPEFSGICSTDIIPILPKEGVSRDYLFYFLRTPDTVNLATSRCSGANLPRLSPKQLASFKIPLPPLHEQKRIAGILDAADALRAKRREALGQLDILLQSTFLDMFGDPVTNLMGWEVVRIEEVGSVQGGLQVTSKRRPLPIERPYLRVANVFRGYLDLDEIKTIRLTEAEERRTAIEDEDILIVEGHGNRDEIGRCALWDGSIEQCVHQNHLIRLRCDRSKVIPLYVESYLNSQGGRRGLIGTSRTTSGLNTISVSKVKAATIGLPPLDLQHRFSAIVESVERQKARQRAHLAELDTLFASLQSRAFRRDL